MTVTASEHVYFDFRSLGWKGFQDLCGTVLSDILGQTYEVLGAGADGGRDGGFRGTWESDGRDSLSGAFTVQCKHTSRADERLSFADLTQEIPKAKELAAEGLADVYILLTNSRHSDKTTQRVVEEFRAGTAIKEFRLFGGAWLSQRVRESGRLRMLVPRLYGLGDLTQILDERAYRQASQLLVSLQEDLRKFVRTKAYVAAAEALEKSKFVCLLGEPASGKSTIASTLALAAADRWASHLVKVDAPEAFADHWNPDEPRQFFWIDDAFGATQYQRLRSDQWNQLFPKMAAAVKRGARIVITSRDYIYRFARSDLKLGSFPLMQESLVAINVQELTTDEKEDILYNHIKLGDQPVQFRTAIKPFLSEIARHPGFIPEIARRLGTTVYTQGLRLTNESLSNFVERKEDFLNDVLRTLGKDQKAALALIFMNGGHVGVPLKLSSEEEEALEAMGSTLHSVSEAMRAMTDGFVRLEQQDDESRWVFRHPTIRDGVARLVREDPQLLAIYLKGARDEELFAEAACGQAAVRRAGVVVPKPYFPEMIRRVAKHANAKGVLRDASLSFLANRCSRAFLEQYFKENPDFIQSLLQFGSWLSAHVEIQLLAQLRRSELLPEDDRLKCVKQIRRLAVETPDADWLPENSDAGSLLNEDERLEILDHVNNELRPRLGEIIENWEDNCEASSYEEAVEYYDPLISALKDYRTALEASDYHSTPDIGNALGYIERSYEDLPMQDEIDSDDADEDFDWGDDTNDRPIRRGISRNRFDDVDQ